MNEIAMKSWLKMCRDKLLTAGKCVLGEKYPAKGIWKFFSTAIGYISSVFAFAVLLNDLFGFDKVQKLCKDNWLILIVMGIIASLIHNHEKISYRAKVDDTDLCVVVKVNDLFVEKANSYVIPTNTFFRTNMEGEYISPQSVQGAFQVRYYRNNTKKLYHLLQDSLGKQGLSGVETRDKFGLVKRFPIGSVAKIDIKGKHYYFVAVNDVNKEGKPINQTCNNIDEAMKGLINYISTHGHCDNLAMSLIGTGRAAIREATIEKVLDRTLDIIQNSDAKIAQKLTICIRPGDYLDGKADMHRIGGIVEYRVNIKSRDN